MGRRRSTRRWRRWRGLLAGIAVLPLAGAGAQEDPARTPGAYHVRVEMAIVQATVRGPKGEFVEGLRQDRFRVLEDGEPREIVLFSEEPEAPVQVAFLLDVSGSMALQRRLPMSRSAIRYFLDRLDPYDQAALFMFAEGAVDVVTDFTVNKWALEVGLLSRDGYGQTALIDAVALAPGLVPRKGDRRGAIVLFSDGMDNISRLGMDEAIDLARRTNVPVYAVGLLDRNESRRREQGREVLQRFARETGGEAFFAQDSFHVNQYARQMVDELKQSYVLGFYPSPGTHSLQVEADCRGCQVTSRQGVYAGPATGG